MTGRFREFLRDEEGGYTIWSLFWFVVYLGIGGLAVDVTDAFRTQSLLQSTADASALASVVELPDENAAVNAALAYAQANLITEDNGIVLKPEDVVIGTWDGTSFNPGGSPPNAVWVTTRRAEENGNPLAVTLLRIIGMRTWDVAAEAVAESYVPDCIRGGLVSANAVNVTSGNRFFNDICIHGQNMVYDNREQDFAVSMGSGNTVEPGVVVSMSDLDDLDGRPNILDKNPGLTEALMEQDVYPKDAMRVEEIVKEFEYALGIDTPPASADAEALAALVPSYLARDLATGELLEPLRHTAKNFPPAGGLEEGRIYEVRCSGNQQVSLPSGIPLRNVAIVTDCRISASNLLDISNVVIVSESLGSGKDDTDEHAISLASDATIGANDFCASSTGDGAVQIYALASVHLAADANISGLRAVVGGDFEMAAGGDVMGVAVQAMDRIDATANGDFGLCQDGPDLPGPYAKNYRLVF